MSDKLIFRDDVEREAWGQILSGVWVFADHGSKVEESIKIADRIILAMRERQAPETPKTETPKTETCGKLVFRPFDDKVPRDGSDFLVKRRGINCIEYAFWDQGSEQFRNQNGDCFIVNSAVPWCWCPMPEIVEVTE